ncbi:unnamed protein product [Cuscuta epithymum]|nr:unnamed protein product [Cuscuta epithymum]
MHGDPTKRTQASEVNAMSQPESSTSGKNQGASENLTMHETTTTSLRPDRPTTRIVIVKGHLRPAPGGPHDKPVLSSNNVAPVVDVASQSDSSSKSDGGSDSVEDPNAWKDRLRSTSTEADLKLAKSMVGSDCTLMLPDPESSLTSPPPKSFFGVHITSIARGMRVPLCPFLVALLAHIGISPCQMTPTAHMFTAAFVARCNGVGIRPSIPLFRACFRWNRPNSKTDDGGFVSLCQSPHRKLFDQYPESPRKWSNKWVWASAPRSLPVTSTWGNSMREYKPVSLTPDLEEKVETLLQGGPFPVNSYIGKNLLPPRVTDTT